MIFHIENPVEKLDPEGLPYSAIEGFSNESILDEVFCRIFGFLRLAGIPFEQMEVELLQAHNLSYRFAVEKHLDYELSRLLRNNRGLCLEERNEWIAEYCAQIADDLWNLISGHVNSGILKGYSSALSDSLEAVVKDTVFESCNDISLIPLGFDTWKNGYKERTSPVTLPPFFERSASYYYYFSGSTLPPGFVPPLNGLSNMDFAVRSTEILDSFLESSAFTQEGKRAYLVLVQRGLLSSFEQSALEYALAKSLDAIEGSTEKTVKFVDGFCRDFSSYTSRKVLEILAQACDLIPGDPRTNFRGNLEISVRDAFKERGLLSSSVPRK